MPLCAPVATGNGLFWRTVENYADQNFCIQQYSGPVWWSDNYRIILSVCIFSYQNCVTLCSKRTLYSRLNR